MAQQNLQTIVSIGGRVDNSFGMIGEALIGMGSQIDMISQKILDFGKESVQKYVNYDDLMREVKAVGEFTNAEITSLDKINSEIAKTTIYANTQAAEAEVLMGQYGMIIPEIKEMLPSTLELAMAGNLSIADSIDYLYSSLKSLGLGVEYARELHDQMAKTAAIGATDIDTLGDSMFRLGSGAKMFKGGSVEIFAILSAMSQFGEDQRGSIAGTWIRNFMLSLAAPMGEVDDIVEAMEQLGATQEEIEEFVGDKSSGIAAQAIDTLMEAGLRIYDESGNLLPAIEIIRSLRDAVKGSGEYAGDLNELSAAYNAAAGDVDTFLASTDGLTDNALYNIFRRIFGRRGVTTALNLISISDAEWEDTIGEIMNSDGFAESMAETMQGGIGGALRELEATFTEFETTIGGIAAPSVEGVSDWLKDIVSSLDEMDEGRLEALLTAIGVIGVAGPGLLTAGLAFRLIGYAMTPAGAILLGGIALGALALGVGKLRDASIDNKFGDMALDLETLGSYVTGLGGGFEKSYGQINEFATALDTAVTAYTNASSKLASNLLTDMLTGVTLTETDKKNLLDLGDEMGKQLTEGIWLSTATTMSNITLLFGGTDVSALDEDYQNIIGALSSAQEDMLANAAGLGQGLRDELLSAFEDGEISDEEYAKIKEWFEAYNAAVAQIARDIQSEEEAIALQVLLHKGQTASFDDTQEYGDQILSARDEKIATLEEQYLHDYYKSKIALDEEIKTGDITETEAQAALDRLEAQYRQKVAEVSAPYDAVYALLWNTSLSESDLSGAWAYMQTLMDGVSQGLYSMEGAMTIFDEKYGRGYLWAPGDAEALAIVTGNVVEDAGGQENVVSNQELQDYALASTIASGSTTDADVFYGSMIGDVLDNGLTTDDARKAINALELSTAWENVGTIIAGNFGLEFSSVLHNLEPGMQAEFARIIDRLNETYDLEAVRTQMPEGTPDGSQGNAFAAWWLLFGDASENPDAYLRDPKTQPIPVVPEIEDKEVQQTISDAQLLLDQTPGYWTINPVLQNFGSYDLPQTGLTGYEDGGRATEASIFGEGDLPEWAIPEEHSDTTADLLLSAAAASGFTWPELLTRTGGLNANPNRTPQQLIYAPTIYANDARGSVEQKLQEDKKRLDDWWADKQLRDEIEVYT